MSTLSQFVGGNKATKSLVHAYSTSGVAPANVFNAVSVSGAKSVLSGALTAATLKTILSVTGQGCLTVAAVYLDVAEAQTLRAKLTIDGVVAFDATCASTATRYAGFAVVGGNSAAGSVYLPETVFFNSSCLFEIASSVTGTDKLMACYKYQTY